MRASTASSNVCATFLPAGPSNVEIRFQGTSRSWAAASSSSTESSRSSCCSTASIFGRGLANASFSRLLGPGFLGSALPQVARGLDQIAELDLGGRVLDLRPWPLAHSGTDLTVFDRQSGVLFAGDLVFDDHTPALDGSLTGWQQVLEDLAALPVTRLVPGHGGPVLDWPEGAAPQRRYLEVLARDTRAAIAAGERLGQAIPHVAASESGRWRLFDTFNPRNATQAFTELEWE